MIQYVKIQNFRGIQEGELKELTPPVVLISPNGCIRAYQDNSDLDKRGHYKLCAGVVSKPLLGSNAISGLRDLSFCFCYVHDYLPAIEKPVHYENLWFVTRLEPV